MKTFTIENENNNITVYATAKAAEGVLDSECFGSEAALATVAAQWPAARLVDIFNSLPGVTPVRKFTDRATAVSRIWKVIQSLGETVPAADPEPEADPEIAPLPEHELNVTPLPQVVATETPFDPPVGAQSPNVAPEAAPAKNKAIRTQKAPKAAEAGPREGSKTSHVIAMLKREGGATLEEIMTAMEWQKHTTRAMLSAGGSLTKNHGLTITSEKVGDKRTYAIRV
jgi:hypothetical protein